MKRAKGIVKRRDNLRHRTLQIPSEQLEIDHHGSSLQAVAFRRELLQPLVDIEKSRPDRRSLPPNTDPDHRIID